jgi:FtsX-like permease family
VAGALALSPLAPVGPVRRFDPSRGIRADALVLGAGAAGGGVILLGLLAVLAVRAARQRGTGAGPRSSALAWAAAAAGLPASAVVGTRNALEPGRSVPVRSVLLGAIAAVTAVVSAVVFNASLAGLISHPARYGRNWDVVIQAEAGYRQFTPGAMSRLIDGQPAVAGWSEFSFAQLLVDGRVVPALGIRRDLGAVQPPTDLTPGTTGAQRARLVRRIVSANPDGTPDGTYELHSALAAAIVNTEQLGGQPLALGIGLAVAAVLSLALTVLSIVRRRRRELALLKALGMTRGQVRAVIAWQTTLTLLIAAVVGGPLGIIGGRLAWHGFARSLGVVPIVEVPVLTLVLGLAALVLAGNLLAALPATVAARTRPGAALRAE